ncbi:hypothetical protein NARC_100106 [Candidatus Nitrosocosmicus arcticus]|uniref:Uncharacterized protein n=1 Tax=Candidatus Nitrosocosmicus arcticus TaxID=2035267 RepID=A0A557STV5_9ARCH|nr:hypothetical protein NARC_100106 [Candidatus Nitrosocosmicus arcticus]
MPSCSHIKIPLKNMEIIAFDLYIYLLKLSSIQSLFNYNQGYDSRLNII